jgi:undecaprenyl diphosphate synthase
MSDVVEDARKVPHHVAIVMDGNGRWAKQQGKSRLAGHKVGAQTLKTIVKCAAKSGVKVLSVFAFSTENWCRPQKEVDGLMALFLDALKKEEVKKLHQNNVRIRFVGDLSSFSLKHQTSMQKAMELTQANTGIQFVIAVNYGGQLDVVQACRKLMRLAVEKDFNPDDITPEKFAKFLYTDELPAPDLFIRTSGEQRISNFFLYQLAYAELYFTDILWPDFGEAHFLDALKYFSMRKRRFGGVC